MAPSNIKGENVREDRCRTVSILYRSEASKEFFIKGVVSVLRQSGN